MVLYNYSYVNISIYDKYLCIINMFPEVGANSSGGGTHKKALKAGSRF